MAEVLHELGIEPHLIAVNLAAFLLVLYLLHRFFFKPFGGFLEDRQRLVREQMTAADRAREEAQAELQGVLAQREELRAELAAEAEKQRQVAREEARRLLEEARRAAQERTQQAEEQIRRELAEAQESLRQETAGLATDIARRALTRALGPEDRERSVEAAVRWVEQQEESESN